MQSWLECLWNEEGFLTQHLPASQNAWQLVSVAALPHLGLAGAQCKCLVWGHRLWLSCSCLAVVVCTGFTPGHKPGSLCLSDPAYGQFLQHFAVPEPANATKHLCCPVREHSLLWQSGIQKGGTQLGRAHGLRGQEQGQAEMQTSSESRIYSDTLQVHWGGLSWLLG